MAANITLAVPPIRFVFAHYHIFKNGGTSIESILEREFGDRYAVVDGPSDNSTVTAEDLLAFCEKRRDISAISSHHLRYPKPALSRTLIFDCCFLRHPLDRLVSVHDYFRRENSSDPLCPAARRGPRDFMRRMLDESPHLVSNVQVAWLATSGAFIRPANDADLDRAAEIFGDMAAPGILDRFNESLVAAEYFLGPVFPAIRLHYTPKNVSRYGSLLGPMRDDELIELWGARIYTEAAKLNHLDLELYRRAQVEMQRRLSLVPNLDQRLAEFENRCAKLSQAALSPAPPVTIKVRGAGMVA